jgi:hypothetical protein
MEKQEKNFLKIKADTQSTVNSEKERQELLSKLSSVVVYDLLRVKDKTTDKAVHYLGKANACYGQAYSSLEELTATTRLITYKKLAVNYIIDELGIKSPKQSAKVYLNEEALLETLKTELGEHSEPIAQALLGVSRKAYSHMDERDTIYAARKLIRAIEKQSDIENLPYVVKNTLIAMQDIERKLSKFIATYSSLRDGIQELNLNTFMEKVVGTDEPAIARMTASLVSDYLSNEALPSWPEIIIEKSPQGKSVGFQIHFGNKSGYFALVYLKPKDYSLIASFVLQLNEMIDEVYTSEQKQTKIPKFSITTYSDLGVCTVGCSGFEPQMLPDVKIRIQRLFGRS